jgi:hypothetical protein
MTRREASTSSMVTAGALAGAAEVLIGLRAAMSVSRASAANLGYGRAHVVAISRTLMAVRLRARSGASAADKPAAIR